MKALSACVWIYVCMHEWRDKGEHSPLHHFMMDKFPPSFRHALVATAMTSGFLLLFWRVVGCDSHMGRCQRASHFSSSYRPPPIISNAACTYRFKWLAPHLLSIFTSPILYTTSLTVNNISSSPISLSWPVWCFRYNKSTENGNSSDKSYYNPMQHNSRGQTALNSRWVLPVPGRKWHWAPSLSYFILAQNRDYHHFIFSTSIPHRVCWKFISVFLFSFSVWIPLGLLSSLARNTGHSNASVLPQSFSSPPAVVSHWVEWRWFHHDWPHTDATQQCVCSCAGKHT